MLKLNKSTTLTGTIEVDGKQAVYLNAVVGSDNDNINVTKNIVDKALYGTNAKEIRTQIKEFEDEVYAVEDASFAEEEATE